MSDSRYINTVEDLVFYTDTDSSDYPIYITPSREIWLKKKPKDIAYTLHTRVKELQTVTSFFSDENDFKEKMDKIGLANACQNEIVNTSVKAVISELQNVDRRVKIFDVEYELFEGDHERFIDTAKAKILKIIVDSRFRCFDKQAWAISFEWEKRIKAKYPILQKYIYAKAIIGKRNYARIIIKVPLITKEFEEFFKKIIPTTITQIPATLELEQQIKQLEEVIQQKQVELQALQEQLNQLKLKLQLEQMKQKLI